MPPRRYTRIGSLPNSSGTSEICTNKPTLLCAHDSSLDSLRDVVVVVSGSNDNDDDRTRRSECRPRRWLDGRHQVRTTARLSAAIQAEFELISDAPCTRVASYREGDHVQQRRRASLDAWRAPIRRQSSAAQRVLYHTIQSNPIRYELQRHAWIDRRASAERHEPGLARPARIFEMRMGRSSTLASAIQLRMIWPPPSMSEPSISTNSMPAGCSVTLESVVVVAVTSVAPSGSAALTECRGNAGAESRVDDDADDDADAPRPPRNACFFLPI